MDNSIVWKRHPVYTTIEVSNTGLVRSLDRVNARGWRIKGRLRKQRVSTDGYLRCDVEGRERPVHILVMETFVGPRPDGMEILHLDAVRTNANLSNLRYGTRSENQRQRVADGNHYLANKTNCPNGHILADPNLRPQGKKEGKRQCLACERAHQWLRRHPEDETSVKVVAERYYRVA